LDGLRQDTQFGPHDYDLVVALNKAVPAYIQTAGPGKLIDSGKDCLVKRDETSKTTNYLVRIPWKNLNLDVQSGLVFGLSLCVFDSDGGRVGHWLQWTEGLTGIKNFKLFNKVFLNSEEMKK